MCIKMSTIWYQNLINLIDMLFFWMFKLCLPILPRKKSRIFFKIIFKTHFVNMVFIFRQFVTIFGPVPKFHCLQKKTVKYYETTEKSRQAWVLFEFSSIFWREIWTQNNSKTFSFQQYFGKRFITIWSACSYLFNKNKLEMHKNKLSKLNEAFFFVANILRFSRSVR